MTARTEEILVGAMLLDTKVSRSALTELERAVLPWDLDPVVVTLRALVDVVVAAPLLVNGAITGSTIANAIYATGTVGAEVLARLIALVEPGMTVDIFTDRLADENKRRKFSERLAA